SDDDSICPTFPYLSSFFFQAEDGIRDRNVTGVQTCALPILFSFGIRQFSKINSVVGDERMPSFFSFLPNENPSVPFSTIKALIPRCLASVSVFAKTI